MNYFGEWELEMKDCMNRVKEMEWWEEAERGYRLMVYSREEEEE